MLSESGVFHNRAKWLLKEGRKLAGAWLRTGSPFAAEIFARAGFDCLAVDQERGPDDLMTLIGQLHAMSRYDAVPLARVAANDPVRIRRILDAGAHGVIVPRIDSRDEAEAAVRACKFPLEGTRGSADASRAGGFGQGGRHYLRHANEQVLVVAAVETPQAAESIDGILGAVGLDGVYVAAADLAASMGFFGNPGAPEVGEAVAAVESAVLASDKFLAAAAGSFAQARELYDRGYALVMAASDSDSLAWLAAQTVKQFRETYPCR